MYTNFGAVDGVIGHWMIEDDKVQCFTLHSDPNSFKDEVSVSYEDGGNYGWYEVKYEDEKPFIEFDGHKLYIDEIKREGV